MDGHRVAFNRAFHELGYDCASWTPAIYHDLMSKGDGTGEGLVAAYYATVGWPTFLPTAEQAMFAGKVHQLKQKEMRKMLQQGLLPLRDGILQVMTEAQAAGATIAIIACTASEPDDDVAAYLLQQLPADLAAAVRVYSSPAHSRPEEDDEDSAAAAARGDTAAAAAGGDAAGADGQGSSSSSSLEASMAAAASRVKQQGAAEFVQRMATALEGKQAGVGVGLDMSLLQAGGPKPSTSAAWLAAVAATLGVPAASLRLDPGRTLLLLTSSQRLASDQQRSKQHNSKNSSSMDQLKLQAQGIPLPSSPAYRTFTPTVVALLAAILTLFCVFVEYEEPEASQGQVSQYYKWLIDVEVMIFIGFGFLMTFLRRYGKSAVGLNFFCSCLVMLAAVLLIGAVQQGLGLGATTIKLELPLLIDATFCAGSAMIAFGAVLGKTTPTQLTWLMLGLVPLYALNQHLCFKTLQALDMGGSITIHAFGAYYGLAASLVLSNKRQAFGAYTSANPKNSASYISDLFSIIGTLFLWMFWPSFNGALASIAVTEGASAAADANPHHISQQYFCVANTLLSLLGSCLSTFATSSLLNNGKFDMMHIQNASLAGGVAMGSASSLRLSPGGALAVGIFAGMMSTLGFARLMPALESKIGLGDTCGVHNLHGLPGLLGGLVAGLAAFGQAAGVAPHGNAQLGYQIAAMACTVAIAGSGGALVSALATGRLGIDQFKSARSRRGDQTEAGDSFENDSLPAIDGMALFDDGAFWTEVAIETPQSGPSDATNTGGSRRGGSRHGGSHRTAGGSAHLGFSGKEASARGVNGALASPKRDVAAPASGLYAGGDQV
ncbi:hypothetical protein OEZ85_002165 [Tetradesmus obliquus]|uniref:Ammonium transporter AmtB-like domain-containing protein n=1 Tax=Tetradesmus obliquus TaxID=3088 RepID=A0ABY8U503_TETOB|nr:hypothetical protein OEZ85_002165 [Tetradesmus obliquus]